MSLPKESHYYFPNVLYTENSLSFNVILPSLATFIVALTVLSVAVQDQLI